MKSRPEKETRPYSQSPIQQRKINISPAFVDKRSSTTVQAKLQSLANNSPQIQKLKQLQEKVQKNGEGGEKENVIQRKIIRQRGRQQPATAAGAPVPTLIGFHDGYSYWEDHLGGENETELPQHIAEGEFVRSTGDVHPGYATVPNVSGCAAIKIDVLNEQDEVLHNFIFHSDATQGETRNKMASKISSETAIKLIAKNISEMAQGTKLHVKVYMYLNDAYHNLKPTGELKPNDHHQILNSIKELFPNAELNIQEVPVRTGKMRPISFDMRGNARDISERYQHQVPSQEDQRRRYQKMVEYRGLRANERKFQRSGSLKTKWFRGFLGRFFPGFKAKKLLSDDTIRIMDLERLEEQLKKLRKKK